MRRLRVLLVLTVLAAGLASDCVAAKRTPPFGVFGTIRGRPFKARSTGRVGDPCVVTNYAPGDHLVLVSAIECRGRRRRTKRNAAHVVLGCGGFDPVATPPPVELRQCVSSGYTEFRTGRFGIPISMAQWGTSIGVVDGVASTSVRVRIDSFDGTYLQGAFYGVFDSPLGEVPSPTAPIDGEVRFRVPVTIQ
jgi:hypothetical protein